jgi:hypothetical protein
MRNKVSLLFLAKKKCRFSAGAAAPCALCSSCAAGINQLTSVAGHQ